MNDLRKAAGEALEALEDVPYMSNKDDYERLEKVKTALRQALETEQEPVAFINVEKQKLEWAKLTSWHTPTIVNLPKIPLYTAPPKRELTCVCGAVWEGEMMVHPPRKAAEWFDCTDAQLMDEVRRRGFVIRDAQIDPVKREWVGLTDDVVFELADTNLYEGGKNFGVLAFAKAIEQDLKKKNHG